MSLYRRAMDIHDDNCKRGFYDDIAEIAETVEDGDIYNQIESMFINQQILLTITELSEAVEYMRKHGIDLTLDPLTDLKMLDLDKRNKIFKDQFKDTFQDEIADTFIRLLDLVGYLDIDIDVWIKAKLEYNRSRPYKHGKKY